MWRTPGYRETDSSFTDHRTRTQRRRVRADTHSRAGGPVEVEVRFYYLEAAPTRDTLSSNTFRLADPIKLNATDEVHELIRQSMARYDIADATVYQVRLSIGHTGLD